ncbi:MAG: DUF4270 family protein [Flavobacteriaceae bacterium]
MIYSLKSISSALAGIAGVMLIMSCEEDGTTLGIGVINESPLRTDVEVYDVFAVNKGISAIQTNKLPIYKLGNFVDPVYGRTEARITTQVGLAGRAGNPTFGVLSQDEEDVADTDGVDTTVPENEVVTEVFLNIPFLQNAAADADGDGVADAYDVDSEDANSDSDGDGVSDNQERLDGTDPLNPDTDGDGITDDEDPSTVTNTFPKKVDLDSIYGVDLQRIYDGEVVQYNVKVERSTFFLRDLDPNAGFLENQEYYSGQQFSPGFVSDVLFMGSATINTEETIIFKEDDPDTEDVDESLEIDQRIQPGIRVPLDTDFFQQNIIDNEGNSQLLSQANFIDFFRGIHLSVSDDILFLLNLTQGNITVSYEYDGVIDGESVTREGDYVITLLTGGGIQAIVGNAVNTLNNEAYPADIASQLDTGENSSRIYLKGGSGSYAEVQLFEENNGETIINEIKANNWIINEANLVFYVDREALDAASVTEEAPRVYLYNADNNRALYNVTLGDEPTLVGRIDSNYGGFLEEENDKGIKYTVRITNYINDLIVRDSANATLGLTVTADITNPVGIEAMLDNMNEEDLPVAASITPLSTVLFGSNVPETEERKLKLEIFYTETN